jgi:CBS-domain-containing membrane protein
MVCHSRLYSLLPLQQTDQLSPLFVLFLPVHCEVAFSQRIVAVAVAVAVAIVLTSIAQCASFPPPSSTLTTCVNHLRFQGVLYIRTPASLVSAISHLFKFIVYPSLALFRRDRNPNP